MKWKKYVSMIICGILVVASCLLSLDKKNVKVKTSGNGEEFAQLSDIQELFLTFVPQTQILPSTVYNGELTETVLPMSSMGRVEKQGIYESAKLTMEVYAFQSSYGSGFDINLFEKSEYYIDSEEIYGIVEGSFANKYSGSSSEDGEYMETTMYKTEIYSDENYSLLRFSDAFRSQEASYIDDNGKENQLYGEENIPLGLEKNTWYSVMDLAVKEYTSFNIGQYFLAFEEEIGKSFSSDAWSYSDRTVDFKAENLPGIMADGAYRYNLKNVDVYGNSDGYCDIYVFPNGKVNPCIVIQISRKTETGEVGLSAFIKFEYVNATSIAKLKKPKIGEIKIVQEEEDE